MVLYPDIYLKNVKEITYDLIDKNSIKGIILDVDNTLIDYYGELLDGADTWCKDLKQRRSQILYCIQ